MIAVPTKKEERSVSSGLDCNALPQAAKGDQCSQDEPQKDE